MTTLALAEAKLSAAERKALPRSSFVFPERRAYPIHDIAHARNALSRVAQHGSPEEKAKVVAAVMKRYPALKARRRARMSEADLLEALIQECDEMMGAQAAKRVAKRLRKRGKKLSDLKEQATADPDGDGDEDLPDDVKATVARMRAKGMNEKMIQNVIARMMKTRSQSQNQEANEMSEQQISWVGSTAQDDGNWLVSVMEGPQRRPFELRRLQERRMDPRTAQAIRRIFDESRHPRAPKGTPEGGEFIKLLATGSVKKMSDQDLMVAHAHSEHWPEGHSGMQARRGEFEAEISRRGEARTSPHEDAWGLAFENAAVHRGYAREVSDALLAKSNRDRATPRGATPRGRPRGRYIA